MHGDLEGKTTDQHSGSHHDSPIETPQKQLHFIWITYQLKKKKDMDTNCKCWALPIHVTAYAAAFLSFKSTRSLPRLDYGIVYVYLAGNPSPNTAQACLFHD